MRRHHAHFALILALVAGVQSHALAQTSPVAPLDPRIVQRGDTRSPALARLLEVLDQVAIVIAGKGFNSIVLGDTFADLLSRWGEPQQHKNLGLLKQKHRWRYQLDNSTVIEFTGKNTIERIRVFGSQQSVIRTLRGVDFHSSPNDVQRLYGPKKIQAKKLTYAQLGIRFEFDQPDKATIQLKQIELFPAN